MRVKETKEGENKCKKTNSKREREKKNHSIIFSVSSTHLPVHLPHFLSLLPRSLTTSLHPYRTSSRPLPVIEGEGGKEGDN